MIFIAPSSFVLSVLLAWAENKARATGIAFLSYDWTTAFPFAAM